MVVMVVCPLCVPTSARGSGNADIATPWGGLCDPSGDQARAATRHFPADVQASNFGGCSIAAHKQKRPIGLCRSGAHKLAIAFPADRKRLHAEEAETAELEVEPGRHFRCRHAD